MDAATVTVSVTPAAAERARALLAAAGLAGGGVRVVPQSSGCAGLVAVLDLAAGPAPGEVEVDAGGVRLYVDGGALPRLHGATLDYRRTATGSELAWTSAACALACDHRGCA